MVRPLSALEPQLAPLPLAVFHLRGTQVAMGEQHGRLVRGIGGYEKALAYYPRMAEGLLRGSQARFADRVLPRMLRPLFEVWLRRLERSRPPELWARSRAFYRALGFSPSLARYLMAMDLFQNAVGLAGRHGQGTFVEPWTQRGLGACSSVAAWDVATEDGRLLHARNFDFPGAGVWDAAPTVVFCSPDTGPRYGFVAARGADAPGATAFNEAGLVVTMHTRLHKDVAFSGLAAIDVGHEIVRRAATLAEAVAVVKERATASTWGLLISSGAERRALLIETTAAGVGVSEPADGPYVICTNHFCHPDLQSGELAPCVGWTPYTRGRFRRLEAITRDAIAGRPFDPERLQGVLGDHRDPDDPETERLAGGILAQCISVQSVVADPERQTIAVSVGRVPTGRGAYAPVAWDWSGPVGVAIQEIRETAPSCQPSRFDTGAPAEARRYFLHAAQLEGFGGDPGAIVAALERAADLDPDESTLQLLAGGCALRKGRWTEARDRFDQGLATERAPFQRGRLLFWAARAADASGDRERAKRYRAELGDVSHPWLTPVHEKALTDARVPFPKAKLRTVPLHVQLGDIG